MRIAASARSPGSPSTGTFVVSSPMFVISRRHGVSSIGIVRPRSRATSRARS
jgi:hypothetical protein